MADDIKKYISIDRIVGQEIPPEFVEKLRVANRIQFPLKDTVTNGVSQPEDIQDRPQVLTEDKINGYVEHVKGMETLVKQLEDMYDDLTKNTNIPAPSDTVAAAAKSLNPDGSTNITRQTIDTAEAILNAFPMMRLGYDPFLLTATGDGSIDGPFMKCNEVTHAMVDAWEISANNNSTFSSTDNNVPPADSIEKAKDSFNKKLKQMIKYLFNMLWWNIIWGRTVIFLLGMMEKIIATPIDAPILIFRFKKPNTPNREKYGPITRVLNILKANLLCKVPGRAWSDYKPDEDIYLVDKRKGSPTKNKSIRITEYCKNVSSNDCPEGYQSAADRLDGTDGTDEGMDDVEDVRNKFNNAFPDSDSTCFDQSFWDKIFKDMEPEGPDTPPECAQNAIVILEAAARDSLTYADYVNPTEQGVQFVAATGGDIGSLT